MKLRAAATSVLPKTLLSASLLSSALLIGASTGLVGSAFAEEVKMPVGSETYAGSLPRRGITKAAVEAEFGTPNSSHGPNGEPPIYYWEYPDFTVYFEGDYVIHTVIKKRN